MKFKCIWWVTCSSSICGSREKSLEVQHWIPAEISSASPTKKSSTDCCRNARRLKLKKLTAKTSARKCDQLQIWSKHMPGTYIDFSRCFLYYIPGHGIYVSCKYTYYLAPKHDMCHTDPEWTLPQVSGGRLSSILMLAMASLSKQSGYKSRCSSPLVALFLKVDATLSAAQCFRMQSTSCIGPSEG